MELINNAYILYNNGDDKDNNDAFHNILFYFL